MSSGIGSRHLQQQPAKQRPLAKSPLLQEVKLPDAGDGDGNGDGDDDSKEDDEEEDEDRVAEGRNEYVAAVCQYTTILKDAPPGFNNDKYEVNYLKKTWSNPRLTDAGTEDDDSGTDPAADVGAARRELRSGFSGEKYRKVSVPAKLPSSLSTDQLHGGRRGNREHDIEYIEDEEAENSGRERNGGGSITGVFSFHLKKPDLDQPGQAGYKKLAHSEEDQEEEDEEEEVGEDEEDEDEDEDEDEVGDAPPVPPPRSKSKESSLVNEATAEKSPSRSPNERSVYYDAVAEQQQGGGVKLSSRAVDKAKRLSGKASAESSESCSRSCSDRRKRQSSKKASSTPEGSAPSSNAGQPQQQSIGRSSAGKAAASAAAAVVRRISLEDLSSAFQVSKAEVHLLCAVLTPLSFLKGLGLQEVVVLLLAAQEGHTAGQAERPTEALGVHSRSRSAERQ